MVTILLVGAAGVLVGWLVGVLSDATDVTRDDLPGWDDRIDGGRHD